MIAFATTTYATPSVSIVSHAKGGNVYNNFLDPYDKIESWTTRGSARTCT